MTGLLGNSFTRSIEDIRPLQRRPGEGQFVMRPGENGMIGDFGRRRASDYTAKELKPGDNNDPAMEFDTGMPPRMTDQPDMMEDSGSVVAQARQMRDRRLAEIAREADSQYAPGAEAPLPEM